MLKKPTLKASKKQNSTRLIASIILGAFFVNTAQPVKLARAEELEDYQKAGYEFKAPQTVNIVSEETKDFEGYNNDIEFEKIIPNDTSSEFTVHGSQAGSHISSQLSVIGSQLEESNLTNNQETNLTLSRNHPFQKGDFL